MFTVIPVIDLLDGQVVYAQRGDRANYRPIQTPLSGSAEPEHVIHGLRSVYPFPIIYIADLGAIQHRSDHRDQITNLAHAFPEVLWWVDAGFTDAYSLRQWQFDTALPVLGTESIADSQVLVGKNQSAVLSLDSHAGQSIDTQQIGKEPALWPDRVIVMTLDRVGSNSGPDLDRLRQVQNTRPDVQVFAAGGVRHTDDLTQLAHQKIAGALIATAIHNGSITGTDVNRLANLP